MAKKTKDTTASAAKKEAKAKAPADPVCTKNLVRLLNILALLLAITAFILQFFAVVTYNWKTQSTDLRSIFAANNRPVPASVYDDSRIEQRYGLFSRKVKVLAHNDEQLQVLASTRFPRLDNNNDEDLHRCLSQTNTLRGSLLTCSKGIDSLPQCNCRRYPYWNAVIFFEIAALILLGLLIFVSALLTTQFHALLKLIGVVLSAIAFLFLLLGLILILSYLKRETRTIADEFPHTHSRLAQQVSQRYHLVPQKLVRRNTHETYRAYSLGPGQHPYNETHFQQYSEQQGTWVQLPYSSLKVVPYEPRGPQAVTTRTTTAAPLYNLYGPLIGYNEVYESTKACIGWSTVLSILALILALAVAGILAFSWLKAKSLGPDVQTITTTTVKTEYVPLPQEVNVETVPLTQSADQGQVVVHDVVIRDEPAQQA